MSELSPAAQAVLAAAFAVEDEWDTIPMIAAALRAAAAQLLAVQWNGQIPADAAHQIGINWARDALHVLANEVDRSSLGDSWDPQAHEEDPALSTKMVL